MAFTYQGVVDLAREPLNDVAKDRYSDTTLLAFANHGMLLLVKRRPDKFVGQFGNLPEGENLLTDIFPLPAGDVQLVADWITARAEMTDDENVETGRAAQFAALVGTEAPP